MTSVRAAAITCTAVSLAYALRLALGPLVGGASPFLLFTPAVMIASFYCGTVAGIAATTLGAVLGSHFLSAAGDPQVERWDRIALFVLVGLVLVVLSHVVRTTRQRLTESLTREQRAREQAEAASRIKDDFLAAVSHELQTPAAVILGWATMIRARPLDGESLAQALSAIERNAKLQSRLVQDVLDTSRIANGSLRLELQPGVSINEVVQNAVEQARPAFEAAGLRLMFHESDASTSLTADPVRLHQVFANLLSNAVKFTPAGGVVTVLVTQAPGHGIVTIADTGVGIDRDFLPRVFQRFSQDTRTLNRSAHGLGLGLSIARNVIDQHHGTITATSEGPGRGTTFTVALPADAGDTVSAPDQSERPRQGPEAGGVVIH